MSRVLLLPSARLVPPELQTEFGPIPSAMVPLDSRPAFVYIARRFLEQGYDIVIPVHEGGEQVTDYVARHPELRAVSVDVGATPSLGETVLKGLEKGGVPNEHLVVNFADTYVDDILPRGDAILYQRLESAYRWTAFELTPEHKIARMLEKDSDKPDGGALPVFVGVFAFASPRDFERDLKRALTEPRTAGLDPFYVAVQSYFNGRRAPHAFVEVKDWRDFGHLDTYYRTKQQFFVNKRYFNSLAIDARRGVVRKTSKNAQKFVNEIRWYLKLPKKLQHLAPRVFDYSLAFENPFIEMEFYGYPALNDLYLHSHLDQSGWDGVTAALDLALDDLQSHLYRPSSAGVIEAALRAMYIEKTIERLRPILTDPGFAPFCQETVVINGQPRPGLSAILQDLERTLSAIGLLTREDLSIIHGDLCLSNVLYDRRSGLVRMIDPRGEFGGFDIYGDPRYDLAKLAHSIEGDYDFFVNGLFDLEWHGGEIRYRAHLTQRHSAIKKRLETWLWRRHGGEQRAVRLIESLLFLSMTPLHADNPRAQQAFLARGIELFDSARKAV